MQQQPSTVHQQQAAQLRLRSFRLLAKKALWKHRKVALAQRNSIWWCVETHCRVENTRSFFENINAAQSAEGIPAINPEARLRKLVAAVPSHAIFPATQANHVRDILTLIRRCEIDQIAGTGRRSRA